MCVVEVCVLHSTDRGPSGDVAAMTVPSGTDCQKPNIFASSSGLDDFDESLPGEAAETRDFADDVRRKIVEEFTRKQEIGGFEVHNLGYVLILTSCLCGLFCRNPTTMCVWRRLAGRSCA